MSSVAVGGANTHSFMNGGSPYAEIYNQYAKQQGDLRNQFVKQLETNKANDTNKSNANYDNTAKQNYIKYMQQSRQLPESLNALGVNGGAAESSLIRLKTNYGNNVATNEANRNTAINDINNNYANKLTSYDEEFQNKLNTAYLTQMENQRKWEQEQREKDLQYFANSITGRFKTVGEYQTLINQLSSSSDPNKDYKIALAQQAMNALAGTSGSGGGGGYSRSRYGGRGGGYGHGGSSSASGDATSVSAIEEAFRAGAGLLNNAPKKSKGRNTPIGVNMYKNRKGAWRVAR
jgi:hypothetical protein|nr:MAG TPA: neurotoxin [Caudoviricetes sp.]